ncbi:MAG: PrsW family intramembrane metalloprotease [Actinobacteria bacterium]|nr:PrsW family intramembrane metalloprotease [Actinomycetota bacterium]
MSVAAEPTAPRRRLPLAHASLYQPGQPAFWLYAAILCGTGVATIAQQGLFRRISPAGWALSWGLVLLYALPAFLVVYLLDLHEREPLSLLLGSLLWGAIAATTLAGFANDGWGLVVARVGGPEFAARWTAALTAPVVEETLKGLGVVMIYLIARDELADVMDGFVYGAVCGLGFAVVEDVFYLVAVFGGSPREVLHGFFLRVIASGLYSSSRRRSCSPAAARSAGWARSSPGRSGPLESRARSSLRWGTRSAAAPRGVRCGRGPGTARRRSWPGSSASR